MTNPYRALCAELDELSAPVDSVPQLAERLQKLNALADRARALLAEPEAEGPTNEELVNHVGWFADEAFLENSSGDIADSCRELIARWGHPAAAPAPEPGEVAAALKVIDKMQQEWVLLGNDEDGTASPSLSMPISLRRFTVLRDAISRAATLLQQQAAPAPVVAPVPVSERLPGPEDCDVEGRCWLGGHQMGRGTPTWLLGYPAWAERFPDVHRFWLPANALPTPEATND